MTYHNQCWGSATFWSTPDPTPFLGDFKDAKKLIFFHIFSENVPTGTLSSVVKINFFARIFCKNFILQAFLTPLREKGRIRIHTSD
jgi:hypothetical protein